MLKASKANRVLRITDELKDTYLALGYTITDMDDNLIVEPVDQSKRAAALEAENKYLKEKLAEYESANKPAEENVEISKAAGRKKAAQNPS